MSIIAGIDCGTQSTKVILFDTEAQAVIGQASSAHELISNEYGGREQRPQWWLSAAKLAFLEAVEQSSIDARSVIAFGVSGQQHGLVVLDADRHVIRPAKLWCDSETSCENTELVASLGGAAKCIEQLGLRIETGYTASKLLWLKKHEPENFSRIAHILLPHDFINYWLTGEFCMEFGDASGTGLLDVNSRDWSVEACNAIDPTGHLLRCLPKLISAEQCVGKVSASTVKELGCHPDAVVASGGGDNMMAAIGTGNIKPGIVTMSLGTSGTVYSFADAPIKVTHPSVANFCSSSNGWLPLICTMNATSTTSLLQDVLAMDLKEFNQALKDSQPGAQGITILPFFNGERVPALPDSNASFHGMTAANFSRINLARAATEAVSFGLLYGLNILRDSGINPTQIRLVGGGSKSAEWRQIIADVTNCEVVCPVSDEAGALGAVIQTIWMLNGKVEHSVVDDLVELDDQSLAYPDPDSVPQYQAAYQHYLSILNQVFPEL